MKQLLDGSWRMRGRFGSLQGAEINEVFAHFVHAQRETDWASAGEAATGGDLERSEPHRRADAVAAVFGPTAAAPGPGKAPLPTLNVLVDERSLELELTGATDDPARFREVVCRTQNGARINRSDAAGLALWGHVRRVVHDGAGTVTDLGRRGRRLAARQR